MNKIEYGKLRSMLASALVIANYEILWKDIVIFNETITKIRSLLQKISKLLEGMNSITDGVTSSKENRRDNLTEHLVKVTNLAMTYAIINNDTLLMERLDMNISAYNKMREYDLKVHADEVIGSVKPLVEDMHPYGLVPEDISELEESNRLFSEKIGTPREAIVIRKGKNEEVSRLMKEVDDLYSNILDRLMVRFKTVEVDSFYNNYFDARQSWTSGIRHRREEVSVIDPEQENETE
ncbi:hypothetical protein DMA11_06485 [Marinilabiliaceae bacterium JC017]|nr:hypothetical protein DMA11_06485 [Marinilabiliaceae bacterium JC017]